MSLGRQRFSIIPAMAVTDRRLKPRDLQVLCLLGRHTDNNGWCCRSQVKMSKELDCGRSTLQRALDRLYEAGYLEFRVNERASGASAAHDYRVVIDPKEADHGDDCSLEVDSKNAAELTPESEPELRETPLPIYGHPLPTDGPPCPPMSGHPLPAYERAPMLTTQDKRISGVVARALAREEGVSQKTDTLPETDLVDRGKRVCEAMGIGWDDPHWTGDVWLITQWAAAGFDFDLDVIPTITGICRIRAEPPASLSYFTKAIARHRQARLDAANGKTGAATGSGGKDRFVSEHDAQSARIKAAIAEVFGEDEA